MHACAQCICMHVCIYACVYGCLYFLTEGLDTVATSHKEAVAQRRKKT